MLTRTNYGQFSFKSVFPNSFGKKRISSTENRSTSFLGQPLPHTHPHFFTKQDEITPGIVKQEYEGRREALMDALLRKFNERVSITIPSHPEIMMSNDIPYPFHQNNNFSYLCGFQEPQSILVIEKQPGDRKSKMTLFVRPRDPSRELWDGPRSGIDGAIKYFGADEAHPFSDFSSIARNSFIKHSKVLFYLPNSSHEVDQMIPELIPPQTKLIDAHNVLSQMRVTKSLSEIQLMMTAGQIAADSMKETMKRTEPGINEYHLSATMEFHIKMRGAQRYSYPPVVAGGINANTLHYIANDMPLRNGDLVLMDAGCEFFGYASDITRVWPVNGKFSDAQLEIYNIVLNANKMCIEMTRGGQNQLSFRTLQNATVQFFAKELAKIGVIPKESNDMVHLLYPHNIGHHLGMDVHDVREISNDAPLRPGMVITIEPGLYIPVDKSIPERYHGIGIRIEDNVVITEDEPLILTKNVPKDPKEIEELMSEK